MQMSSGGGRRSSGAVSKDECLELVEEWLWLKEDKHKASLTRTNHESSSLRRAKADVSIAPSGRKVWLTRDPMGNSCMPNVLLTRSRRYLKMHRRCATASVVGVISTSRLSTSALSTAAQPALLGSYSSSICASAAEGVKLTLREGEEPAILSCEGLRVRAGEEMSNFSLKTSLDRRTASCNCRDTATARTCSGVCWSRFLSIDWRCLASLLAQESTRTTSAAGMCTPDWIV
mmetsp:Transcript_15161/g.33452  ORF Transcript_15161/g.33452 Transcript_15161/m.33452 type:complete len:232 (-) Transcript_15161:405-1100(-)